MIEVDAGIQDNGRETAAVDPRETDVTQETVDIDQRHGTVGQRRNCVIIGWRDDFTDRHYRHIGTRGRDWKITALGT